MTQTVDIAAIRAAIVTTLQGIPEIKKVNQYDFKGEARNNAPFANVQRGPVTGHTVSLYSEEADLELGKYDHLITWQIRVYMTAFRHPADAQAADDVMAMRLLEAFNGNRRLDPNGPGVVDVSRVPVIEPFIQDDTHSQYWVCEATLITFSTNTL